MVTIIRIGLPSTSFLSTTYAAATIILHCISDIFANHVIFYIPWPLKKRIDYFFLDYLQIATQIEDPIFWEGFGTLSEVTK